MRAAPSSRLSGRLSRATSRLDTDGSRPPPSRGEPSAGGHVDGRHITTSASRRHASPRAPFDRRPIRTRMGVMGNAPVVQLADFSLLFVPPKSRPRLATPRPLPGGRYTPPLNRRSLAFAPAFPPAAETLAGKSPLAAGQDAVRRPSYYSRVRPPGPLCLPGGRKRPPRARGN